jgi:hypothetical protein
MKENLLCSQAFLCNAQTLDFLPLSVAPVVCEPCISAVFQHSDMLKPALSLLREGFKSC